MQSRVSDRRKDARGVGGVVGFGKGGSEVITVGGVIGAVVICYDHLIPECLEVSLAISGGCCVYRVGGKLVRIR